MRIYRQLDELSAANAPVVATIGNFDGVHLGHQAVIAEVIARARFLGGQSLAITFDPHPARVLRPEQPQPLITPLQRKLELLADTGIDATLVLPFTEELGRSSARDFATQVLVRAIQVTEVHEGANFRFGHHAEAGVSGPSGLQSLGRELGFNVFVYAPRSRPRRTRLLQPHPRADCQGRREPRPHAAWRPLLVDSTPASGRGFGARYAVPTINLAPYCELLPANGVYITTLTVGSGNDAESFQAVTNLGVRPTFGEASFAVESHLLDFHPIELTEKTALRLTFMRRLRGEERFASPEALREQIARDVARARRYFELCHYPA